jgi:hypothetical protein
VVNCAERQREQMRWERAKARAGEGARGLGSMGPGYLADGAEVAGELSFAAVRIPC